MAIVIIFNRYTRDYSIYPMVEANAEKINKTQSKCINSRDFLFQRWYFPKTDTVILRAIKDWRPKNEGKIKDQD